MEAVVEKVAEKRKLSDLTYDQLAAARVALDGKIKEQDDVVDALKAKREKVNQEFLRRFNEQGVQNVKTKHGTPHIVHRSSCTVADWDAFRDWVIEGQQWDFLERRANKTMVQGYKESSEGALPPGLNWSVKADLGFKK